MLFFVIAPETNSKTLSEEEIVKIVEKLYHKYYIELVTFCRTKANIPNDAADIVHNAFLLLMQKYDESKAKNVRGWLYKTVSFMARNYSRNKKNLDAAIIHFEPYDDGGFESFFEESTLLEYIRNGLSKDEYDFFIDCFTRNKDDEPHKIFDPQSSSMRVKKSRIRQKVIKILEKNGIVPKVNFHSEAATEKSKKTPDANKKSNTALKKKDNEDKKRKEDKK